MIDRYWETTFGMEKAPDDFGEYVLFDDYNSETMDLLAEILNTKNFLQLMISELRTERDNLQTDIDTVEDTLSECGYGYPSNLNWGEIVAGIIKELYDAANRLQEERDQAIGEDLSRNIIIFENGRKAGVAEEKEYQASQVVHHHHRYGGHTR